MRKCLTGVSKGDIYSADVPSSYGSSSVKWTQNHPVKWTSSQVDTQIHHYEVKILSFLFIPMILNKLTRFTTAQLHENLQGILLKIYFKEDKSKVHVDMIWKCTPVTSNMEHCGYVVCREATVPLNGFVFLEDGGVSTKSKESIIKWPRRKE